MIIAVAVAPPGLTTTNSEQALEPNVYQFLLKMQFKGPSKAKTIIRLQIYFSKFKALFQFAFGSIIACQDIFQSQSKAPNSKLDKSNEELKLTLKLHKI